MKQSPESSLPIICLMGPTAAGKTAVAVDLARDLPLDIVSVDSAMVYRGMDVGTAKPEAEVLECAPHRLIDIRDPVDVYSAADFRNDALREIRAIHAAGRIPLLVGGTMLYFRALTRGLSELPPANPDIRAELVEEARRQGWRALHRRLESVDPAAARRIHANDIQRIQRALEVHRLTGRPLSTLQVRHGAAAGADRFVRIALSVSHRDRLHARIAERFHGMLEAGFIEEVQALRARGDLGLNHPSMRAVGYRQIWQYLDGDLDYTEMVDRAVAASRQFAKRQLTWLRSEPDLEWYEAAGGLSGQLRTRLSGLAGVS